jgi:cobalt/nickel transport system ATP-binding protein
LSETIVSFKNVSFSYGSHPSALREISFSIGKNENTAIIGGNGAGKSTLLLHINGLLRGEGSVEVFGLPVKKNNFAEIRKRTGLLFQDPDDQLFCPTVFEDVAFGPLNLGLEDAEVKNRVVKALEQVGLEGFENRSPHHLSYGEEKRISLSTLFAMEPELLALDEPTSNLDPKTRRCLIGILKNYTGTLILATHDLEVVLELCPHTILLNKGELVKDGKTIDILSDKKLMNENDLEVPLSIKFTRPSLYESSDS